ncbi:hypothetical protein F5Y15DRAFT_142580 [Xylariaceae sp. FL0016]|nr:hypothetical protein F5Y15DRAFT_142580 [Xylariaceae sp. FL0016]
MAILEDCPGVEVTVQIDGQDVTEYDDPDSANEGPVSTKYIECRNDVEFASCTRISDDYDWSYRNHQLRVEHYVDGRRFNRSLCRIGKASHLAVGEEVYCEISKQWLLRKVRFSSVATVDDSQKDRVKKDIKTAEKLGTIEVLVTRVIRTGTAPRSKTKGTCHEKSGGIELAEKSLKGKAISHGASFSKGKRTYTSKHTALVERLREDNGPIAVFRFHYRSRDALKSELIIPRSPSLSPKSAVANLSRGELERLARERLRQMGRDENVKQERKPIIKRESGEVVDVTQGNEQPRSAKRQKKVEYIDLGDL